MTPDEQHLIKLFLDKMASERLSPEALADQLEGISGPTIRRYMAGRFPARLDRQTVLAMESYVWPVAGTGDEEEEPVIAGRPKSPVSRVEAELERIAALDVDEDTRTRARDSLAATIRAEMALVDARAGELRARLAPAAEDAARARALVAEAIRTRTVPRELIGGREVP